MFRIVIILLLIFILVLQPVHNLLIVLNYVINKEFISTVLCINRDKPELNCNGKCQVAEQLKEQEKKKNEQKGTITDKIDIPVYIPVSNDQLHPPIEKEKYHIIYNPPTRTVPPYPIFHPPRTTS
jgi:hypothetical protein